jgi:uncharacterized cupredoxin-like copper-binding protein
MRIFGYIFLFVLAVGLLAACSQKTPELVSYTIEMTEYAFSPSTIEATVGQQVTMILVNKGTLEHEIMIGRDVMMKNSRPSGYQHDMFTETGVEPTVMMIENMQDMGEGESEEEGHTGFMVHLAKTGDQATMTFTVTKDMIGEWEIGCFELDGVHYEQGMVGKFIVTP